MRPKGADGMANSVDPDQEQSDLAQTSLSENIESLRYSFVFMSKCCSKITYISVFELHYVYKSLLIKPTFSVHPVFNPN